MYHVYAIQSHKDNRIYIGLSSDFKRRIGEHNSGPVKSTKPYIPWSLIYLEKCTDIIEARKREKYFKSGRGKGYLKQNYSRVVQRPVRLWRSSARYSKINPG